MKTIMNLREYQIISLNEIDKQWQAGKRVLLLQLSTGAGKTVIFCELIKKNKGKTLFIAHRNQLLAQASLCLAQNGIYHDVVSSESTKKIISQVHHLHLKQSYYKPGSKIIVSAIDTLIRKNINFKAFDLVIVDEGHHVIRENKWGTILEKCSNARILLPTATPERLDGKGLGATASGFADDIIVGTEMKYLIENGFLSDYKIAAPPSDLILANVKLSRSGEYAPRDLVASMQKSRVIGDIAHNYVKFAAGKLGLTFVTDLNTAESVKLNYLDYGVPCEIISSKTSEIDRAKTIQRFKNREILQLISVDLLGEGVDIPAVEVVSMARPTQSFAVYAQQFGRALRPSENKKCALIIDHVGNVFRHGVPDSPRIWSLDDRTVKRKEEKISSITTCTSCFLVYEIHLKQCPFCKKAPIREIKRTPEAVHGDLTLLSKHTINVLKAQIKKIHSPPMFPMRLLGNTPARIRLSNIYKERRLIHEELQKLIDKWAHFKRTEKLTTPEIYKLFYVTFGVDVLTAQILEVEKAKNLTIKIKENLA